MDTTNLIIVVKYSDERGVLRFTQTIDCVKMQYLPEDKCVEVVNRGMGILFDALPYRNDRQVIVLAYTAEEHALGLDGYDVPVTVLAGDVVPYPADKVLAFVAAYRPSDLELSQHRLKHIETLKQRRQREDGAYPDALQSAAMQFADCIAEIKRNHEEELARIAALDAYLYPMAGDKSYTPPTLTKPIPAASQPPIDERLAELDNVPMFSGIHIGNTVSDEDIERMRREWAANPPNIAATTFIAGGDVTFSGNSDDDPPTAEPVVVTE